MMNKEDEKNLDRITEVLLGAIRKESEAFNYYYQSSQKTPYPETKSLLMQLAGEERKHRMILIRELQTLKGLLKRGKKGEEFIKKDEISYHFPDKLDYKKIQTVPKLDISTVSFPSQLTGGDYFDTFPILDKYQALLLFDVAGHGLKATSVKGLVRSVFDQFKESYLEAQASSDVFNPSYVAKMLNQKVWECCHKEGTFLTLFYVLFQPDEGKLSYLSAGHEPPIFLKNGKSDPEIIDSDLLIGVDKDKSYSGIEAEVDPGDLMILFSDGLVETFGFRDIEFKREELVDLISQHRESDVKEIIKIILDFVKAKLKGKTLTDEFTLTVIKIK
jgi:sigma-B regulation protein RsbU (phosphoserine phosphatase)